MSISREAAVREFRRLVMRVVVAQSQRDDRDLSAAITDAIVEAADTDWGRAVIGGLLPREDDGLRVVRDVDPQVSSTP
ncbi:MAG: hypothetical protein M3N17_09035 [Actinomycetota bacterium]|nr:hypothetical protein [Actinomycetota bacterium]